MLCKHQYKWIRNIYGDEIIRLGYKRSVWECNKCGKHQYRDKLYNE